MSSRIESIKCQKGRWRNSLHHVLRNDGATVGTTCGGTMAQQVAPRVEERWCNEKMGKKINRNNSKIKTTDRDCQKYTIAICRSR